jgi:hypothetical protein
MASRSANTVWIFSSAIPSTRPSTYHRPTIDPTIDLPSILPSTIPSTIPSILQSPSCSSAADVERVYYQARDGALAVGIALAATARP